MFLVRLVYTSEVVRPIADSEIERILLAARANNQNLGLTGMLCFHRKYFLQCLEGSRTQVNKMYRTILKDERHTNIVLLDYQEIVAREFDSWTMGYMPESTLTEAINMKFSGTKEFTPYEMLGESCHQMMIELREKVPVV
ncbi:MAG: BLUF domain-containing protein [Pseudomonadota bacterium]|nr:BLUF domain-containing protein [Pseudomonadota bacterium]